MRAPLTYIYYERSSVTDWCRNGCISQGRGNKDLIPPGQGSRDEWQDAFVIDEGTANGSKRTEYIGVVLAGCFALQLSKEPHHAELHALQLRLVP